MREIILRHPRVLRRRPRGEVSSFEFRWIAWFRAYKSISCLIFSCFFLHRISFLIDGSSNDDIYDDVADDAYEEEEEEIEEEYYEEEEEWYWDEYPSSYDDDIYEDDYWVRPNYLVGSLNESSTNLIFRSE